MTHRGGNKHFYTDYCRFKNSLMKLHYVRLGQVRLRRCLQSAIGQVDHMLGQVRLLRRSLRYAIGPNNPQDNRQTDQSRFKKSLMQLHYFRLGQVRLKRSLRSAINQVDHMLGQVRFLTRSLRSTIGPNYPQANQLSVQSR